MKKNQKKRQAVIRNIAELPWIQYPGHYDRALSKEIVSPNTTDSKIFDYRISTYQPGAFVESHVHQVQEQIYHFLSGEGLLIVDDQKYIMHEHDVAYIPPGVVHELHNTGLESLVFLVITSPFKDQS
jgi:mannose-6-phosphate isomerase-like protein (cupin superfamily)